MTTRTAAPILALSLVALLSLGCNLLVDLPEPGDGVAGEAGAAAEGGGEAGGAGGVAEGIAGGGAIGCGSGETLCDGACVDVSSDSDNCGLCGYGCASECVAGSCLLSTQASGSVGLSVDSQHVYFGSLWGGMRVSRSGGATETVFTTSSFVDVVRLGDRTFGLTSNGLVVVRRDGDELLFVNDEAPEGAGFSLVADAMGVFWATGGPIGLRGELCTVYHPTSVDGLVTTGCADQPYVAPEAEADGPYALALDANWVYWATFGAIKRHLRVGPTQETLVSSLDDGAAPSRLYVHPTSQQLYWTNVKGALWRVDSDGSSPAETIYQDGDGHRTWGVAFDATHVYFTTSNREGPDPPFSPEGKLMRKRLDAAANAPAELVTAHPYRMSAIAIDGDDIFYATSDRPMGRVFKRSRHAYALASE